MLEIKAYFLKKTYFLQIIRIIMHASSNKSSLWFRKDVQSFYIRWTKPIVLAQLTFPFSTRSTSFPSQRYTPVNTECLVRIMHHRLVIIGEILSYASFVFARFKVISLICFYVPQIDIYISVSVGSWLFVPVSWVKNST